MNDSRDYRTQMTPASSTPMPFEPNDEQRRTVKAMSGFGIPQPDIATHVGIDPKTLRKHFRDELDRGSIEATTKVAQSLFRMATEGNNVAAAIFWMKARAGWREKQQVELSGPEGGPVRVIEDTREPLADILKRALASARSSADDRGLTHESDDDDRHSRSSGTCGGRDRARSRGNNGRGRRADVVRGDYAREGVA